jgi:hypothetical protein
MSGELGDMLTLHIGSTGREILAYTKDAQGVYDENVRTGTRVTLDCQLEIAATPGVSLPQALAAFGAWAVDGADVQIKLRGTAIEHIAPAACREGPRVAYKLSDDAGESHQIASLAVEALLGPATGTPASSSQSTRTAVNLEGLRTITTTGQVSAVSAASAAALALLPARPAGWQRVYEYEVNADDTVCKYSCTLTELIAEYPAGGGNRVVDGERTISREYDEHNRLVTRYSCAYVGPWAAGELAAQHAALRAAGGLVSAHISETTHKTQACTGEFSVLAARVGGGEVLELTESVSHARSGPLLREVRYAGTTPLVVQEAAAAYMYTQSGRAVGLAAYPTPPEPVFDDDNLAEAPEIVLSRPNDHEFETSWRYRFLFVADQGVQAPNGRAGSEGYY